MLNISNTHNGRTNAPSARQKTAKRQQSKKDQKRLDLLATLLEESTLLSLHSPPNQLSSRTAIDNHSRLFDLIGELRIVESQLNPKLPTRDEKSWARFREWVSARETEALSNTKSEQTKDGKQNVGLFEKVGIKRQIGSASAINDNTNEYSLAAKVPFKKSDRIFEISRHLMLTTETALKEPDLADFVKNDSIASGLQNVTLVLHLLNEYSKQEKSQWWPYLSILPNKILPILSMNKEQITDYLMASGHLHTALKMLRAIIRQYCYFYKRLQSTKLPLRHNLTFLFYTWGVSMVCSRQNKIPHSRYRNSQKSHNNNNNNINNNDEDIEASQSVPASVHALIPVLDMCNHDKHSNQATFEGDHSCLVADRDLLPNQEITINYGCRSSGDFYIHNGFVPDDVSFDMIGISITLNPQQDPLYDQKLNVLKTLNMPKSLEAEFTLRSNDYENRHRRDPHLTMFLIVNFLTEEEIKFMMESDNPVGVADEIYDYVQYESCSSTKQQPDGVSSVHDKDANATSSSAEDKKDVTSPEAGPVDKMKRRILDCIKNYLSRRASISIALIDRTIKTLESRPLTNDYNDEIRASTIKLLQHEMKIYESHVLK